MLLMEVTLSCLLLEQYIWIKGVPQGSYRENVENHNGCDWGKFLCETYWEHKLSSLRMFQYKKNIFTCSYSVKLPMLIMCRLFIIPTITGCFKYGKTSYTLRREMKEARSIWTLTPLLVLSYHGSHGNRP